MFIFWHCTFFIKQDFIYDRDNNKTIFTNSDEPFWDVKGIVAYQYIQNEKGFLVLVLQVDDKFKEEYENILRTKKSTSSWGGTSHLPYAFTEQGVYMLMTVLKGELAIRQSKALIRIFKSMKDYIIENKDLLND